MLTLSSVSAVKLTTCASLKPSVVRDRDSLPSQQLQTYGEPITHPYCEGEHMLVLNTKDLIYHRRSRESNPAMISVSQLVCIIGTQAY